MKNLAQLKMDCLNDRALTEAYPDNKAYQITYEQSQRKVQARERELFCTVKEQ